MMFKQTGVRLGFLHSTLSKIGCYNNILCGCDGMVDIGDLKSSGVKSRAGSSPVARTNMESYSRGLRGIPAKDVDGHTCVGSNPTGSFEISLAR